MKRIKNHPPQLLDLAMRFFPFIFSSLLILISIKFTLGIVLAILILYLLPPFIWRLLTLFGEMPIGPSYLGSKASSGNLWYSSYQLQWIFTAFPFFERLLMLFPEGYSNWLRLWGAKVGTKINWTPECKIVDRPLIEIGDRVLIGNRAYLAGHAIKKKDGKYLLWVSPIRIGDDSVLAFSTVIAPGVEIGKNCFIEAGAALYPGQKVGDGEIYERV